VARPASPLRALDQLVELLLHRREPHALEVEADMRPGLTQAPDDARISPVAAEAGCPSSLNGCSSHPAEAGSPAGWTDPACAGSVARVGERDASAAGRGSRRLRLAARRM
jgi:hypothetical protein